MHARTLTALIGILIGVVCGESVAYGSEIALLSLLLAISQCGLYVWERNKKEVIASRVRQPFLFSVALFSSILFFFITIGIMRVQFVHEKNYFVCESSCTFTATIIASPKIQNDYQVVLVQPDEMSDVYAVQIQAPLYPRYRVGESTTVRGKVTLPQPMMAHDGKKSFDYEMYLRMHDVGSEMFYPKIVVSTSTEDRPSLIYRLAHIREQFVGVISMNVNEPAASLASGMLFGATSMSKELVQTFRVAGLSHIVVLSGFNIAILISFVLFILVFLPLMLRVFLAALFVLLFVVMVGGEASIIRATLMSFIGLTALVLGRAYTAKQALILSLIGIIMYEPGHLLYDVSLHLSFLAAAGIIYMSDGIKNILRNIKSPVYQEIIATTLCAYLATLPYVMYTFGTMSLYALLTNSIVLPLVPLIMLITFLVVVISPLTQSLAQVLGYVDTILGNGIIFVARAVEHLPLSSIKVSVSFVTMGVLYGVLVVMYIFFVGKFNRVAKNETSVTNDNEILSEVISF